MARRKKDEHTAPLWIESGETRTAPLISVAPAAPIDKVYTYTTSEEMLACLRIGQRVSVPFGRKGSLAPAYVVGIERGEWTSTLKPIAEILDPAGQLSDHLLELGKWISQYYCCPLGRCLAAMIPQAVRKQSGFTTVRHITLTASESDLDGVRLGKKQKEIIEALRGAGGTQEANTLLESSGASRSTLRGLMDKGWVTETVAKEPPKPAENEFPREEPDFDINEDQQKALTRISEVLSTGEFAALLLYGKSGSGKNGSIRTGDARGSSCGETGNHARPGDCSYHAVDEAFGVQVRQRGGYS